MYGVAFHLDVIIIGSKCLVLFHVFIIYIVFKTPSIDRHQTTKLYKHGKSYFGEMTLEVIIHLGGVDTSSTAISGGGGARGGGLCAA